MTGLGRIIDWGVFKSQSSTLILPSDHRAYLGIAVLP